MRDLHVGNCDRVEHVVFSAYAHRRQVFMQSLQTAPMPESLARESGRTDLRDARGIEPYSTGCNRCWQCVDER